MSKQDSLDQYPWLPPRTGEPRRPGLPEAGLSLKQLFRRCRAAFKASHEGLKQADPAQADPTITAPQALGADPAQPWALPFVTLLCFGSLPDVCCNMRCACFDDIGCLYVLQCVLAASTHASATSIYLCSFPRP